MQNEYGDTALFAACSQGHYDPAALLIGCRADVNYLSKVRPLHVHDLIHCRYGRIWCAQFRARWGLILCYVHGHSVWVIDACTKLIVGSILNFRAT